jgi:hypothetical protein
MKMKKSFFLCFFILTINIINATAVSSNGKLKVTGLQLVNECGNAVQLRGVSTHGLQWYGNCNTDASLNFAANANGMGADIVRIAMYVDENGYLTNPSSFTNQVDTLVDKIGALGMYALIDWHVLTPGDPNAHINEAGTFWQHEATQHKGKKYVLYEICNEPNGVNWATVKQYADNIIPKIRAIDPDTVIICGTPNWSQLGSDVVNNKLSYSNVMYTFHFYAASHSTGLLTPYVGSLPIFCTEWAACSSSGNGTLDTGNAANFLNIMAGNNSSGQKISWCSWSFSDAGETSAQFNSGTCAGGNFDTSHLSTEGNFIRNNILTPGKTFITCGGSTSTFTPVPKTATPTYTRTATVTITAVNSSPTFTKTNTLYLGTPTITYTSSPVPTPGLVNAECAQGQTVIIDGNLSDPVWQGGTWTAVTKTVEGTQGTVSAVFKTVWTSGGLLVGVNITDPALCNSGANWYQDDAVEIYIDSAGNRATTYDANDYQFSIRYGDPVVREENNKTGGVTAGTYKTTNGYSAEFIIPWTSIGIAGTAGTSIGFDVGIDHNETCGATRTGVLMWNGTGNNYSDTSAFGNCIMSACLVTPTLTTTVTKQATPTFTLTWTNTPANTPVNTATQSNTNTCTETMSITASVTKTPTPSRTQTVTNTMTIIDTKTQTPTTTQISSQTFTLTATPVYSATATSTITETQTGTPPTPTYTLTQTLTVTISFTKTVTITDTATRLSTPTNTVTQTSTYQLTNTASPQATKTFTMTVTATVTFTATLTPTNIIIIPTPTEISVPVIEKEGIYPNPCNPEYQDLHLNFNLSQAVTDADFLIYSHGYRLVLKVKLGACITQGNKVVIGSNSLKKLASGIYFYVVRYKTTNGYKQTKIGQIFILR